MDYGKVIVQKTDLGFSVKLAAGRPGTVMNPQKTDSCDLLSSMCENVFQTGFSLRFIAFPECIQRNWGWNAVKSIIPVFEVDDEKFRLTQDSDFSGVQEWFEPFAGTGKRPENA